MSSTTKKTTIGLRGGSYVVVPMSAFEVAERLGLDPCGTPPGGFFEFTQSNGYPALVNRSEIVSIVESDPEARKPAKTVFVVGGAINVEQGDGRGRRATP